jgi:heat shock protein HslJ
MKKNTLLATLFLFLSFCVISLQAQPADERPTPYFTGFGSEPGWNIVMLQGQDRSFEVDLTTDYGAKRLRGNMKEQRIAFADSFRDVIVGDLSDGKEKIRVEIQLIEELSHDDAEREFTCRVAIKLPERELTGCGDMAKTLAMNLDGRYQVTAIDGVRIKKKNSVQIDVFQRKINAKMGCNTMNAYFLARKNEKIEPVNFATTRMACPDMKLENLFSGAMKKVKSFHKDRSYVVFLDENSNKIVELKKIN